MADYDDEDDHMWNASGDDGMPEGVSVEIDMNMFCIYFGQLNSDSSFI